MRDRKKIRAVLGRLGTLAALLWPVMYTVGPLNIIVAQIEKFAETSAAAKKVLTLQEYCEMWWTSKPVPSPTR